MDIKEGWLLWFINFLRKKTKGSGVTAFANKSAIKSIIQNGQLAEELHKLIRKFNKRKVYSAFKDNIWAADLADMQLISKFNKGFRFLLCIIDTIANIASIFNVFQSILKKSNRKSNKIWIDKGGEFYNRSMKSWLERNDIEMFSTHNEGKSIVAERFIRTIKNKIYEYMTSISKNVYIDKLDDIVHKYNNKKHRTIKMLKTTHILTLEKNLIIIMLNLKLVSMGEYRNIKTFLLKAILQIGLK